MTVDKLAAALLIIGCYGVICPRLGFAAQAIAIAIYFVTNGLT